MLILFSLERRCFHSECILFMSLMHSFLILSCDCLFTFIIYVQSHCVYLVVSNVNLKEGAFTEQIFMGLLLYIKASLMAFGFPVMNKTGPVTEFWQLPA